MRLEVGKLLNKGPLAVTRPGEGMIRGIFLGWECVTSQKKGPERLVQGQKKPLNQGALAWSQHSENFSRPLGQTQGFQIRL